VITAIGSGYIPPSHSIIHTFSPSVIGLSLALWMILLAFGGFLP
jgi:hypothetical protein